MMLNYRLLIKITISYLYELVINLTLKSIFY
jgi:hypothetical protein